MQLYHHGLVNAQLGSSLEAFDRHADLGGSKASRKRSHYAFLSNNSGSRAVYEMYYGLEDVQRVKQNRVPSRIEKHRAGELAKKTLPQQANRLSSDSIGYGLSPQIVRSVEAASPDPTRANMD